MITTRLGYIRVHEQQDDTPTKLLKNADIKIAYKTNKNSIQKVQKLNNSHNKLVNLRLSKLVSFVFSV